MKILIADDEKNIRESLQFLLENEGYCVTCVQDGLEAQIALSKQDFNLFICDLKMPKKTGLDLLKYLNSQKKELPVIMISAYGQIEDAVNALKLGAKDYIVKPFNPEELIEKVKIYNPLESKINQNNFILGALESTIHKIAKTPSTILLTGESGCGKEVTARAIHQWSAHKNGPFMGLNLGGISESLLESELFGHEKGAFTGAEKKKLGLFELAKEGTLFLDEIGEIPLSIQVKLLRVLQERSFKPLGGVKDIPLNARIIAATNANLQQKVKDGSFREDLYYRLYIAPIKLLPLRERQEDLPILVHSLINKLNKKMNCSILDLSPQAWDSLKNYSFPGNIRELENTLERAMIFTEGNTIEEEDLNLPQDLFPKASSSGSTLKEQEKESIRQSLIRCDYNRTNAAKELGISRRTIINKIKEYEL